MKKIKIYSSDGFINPSARVAARSLSNALERLLDVMDRYDDYLEMLLDDPSYYDATVDELRRLKAAFGK